MLIHRRPWRQQNTEESWGKTCCREVCMTTPAREEISVPATISNNPNGSSPWNLTVLECYLKELVSKYVKPTCPLWIEVVMLGKLARLNIYFKEEIGFSIDLRHFNNNSELCRQCALSCKTTRVSICFFFLLLFLYILFYWKTCLLLTRWETICVCSEALCIKDIHLYGGGWPQWRRGRKS